MLSMGSEHTNNISAASIGAVGSLISFPLLCLLYLLIPTEPGDPRHAIIPHPKLIAFVCPIFSILAGVIGCTVLLQYHVDLGDGIDSSYAFSAASVAGLLLVIPAMLFGYLIPLLVSSIFWPISLAFEMGIQWVRVKWTEIWTDRNHSYSHGSRGDDPEINAELHRPPGRS